MGEERDGPVTPKKKYTPEFKLRVVREALEVGIYKEVARRYQIDASMVGRWVRQYRQEGESAFDRTLRRQQTPAPTDVQQRLKELERENDWPTISHPWPVEPVVFLRRRPSRRSLETRTWRPCVHPVIKAHEIQ